MIQQMILPQVRLRLVVRFGKIRFKLGDQFGLKSPKIQGLTESQIVLEA